jgi:uncharacterized membrane protein HdeD (DUF308 family)
MTEDIGESDERLRAAAVRARGGLSDRMGGISRALTVKAVLLAVLGVCVIVWPTTAFNILLLAVALMLIVDGIAGFVSVFRANERGAFLGQSILSLVLGAILLLWPGATARTLMLVLGAWALLHGVMLLWSLREISTEAAYRDLRRTVGIVLAIVGVILLLWPGAGIVTLSWVIGIGALVIAGVLAWLASRMRQLKSRVAAEAV